MFALSCDCRLLLSTSAKPPTLHLRNLATNSPPLVLRPLCSSSAAVAAAFHPERPEVFILAYADGNVAVYDAMHMITRNGKARDSETVSAGSAGEVASIKGLHTPMTKIMSEDVFKVDSYDPGTGKVSVTANTSGIASVALLPGRRATAVTVGADGKCCVVDFTQPNKRRAVLLKSWHLRRPATSVSVIYARDKAITEQARTTKDRNLLSNKDYYIAIGRQDGKVLLFDLNGKQLAHQLFDCRRSRIIDVEWAKIKTPPMIPIRSDSIFPVNNEADENNGKLEYSTRQTSRQRTLSSPIEQDSLFDFTTPRRSLGFTPSLAPSQAPEHSAMLGESASQTAQISRDPDYPITAMNHLVPSSDCLISAVKPSVMIQLEPSTEVPMREIKMKRSSSQNTKSENTSQWGTTTSFTHFEGRIPPPIPPRPSLKPSGRSYMRRVQRAREAANKVEYRTSSSSRRISTSSSRSHRPISSSTLPRTKVLMGPRPLRKRSRTASLQARIEAERASQSSRLSSYVLNPLPNGSNTSMRESIKSYKTASSHLQSSQESEHSNDTIVDWSPAASQRPLPTPLEHPSTSKSLRKPKRGKAKQNHKHKKGHVSVSSLPSTTSEDTICNWPKYEAPAIADTTPSIMTSRADETGTSLTSGQRSPILESATALVLAGGHYNDSGNSSPGRSVKEGEEGASIGPLLAVPVLRDRAVASNEPERMQPDGDHHASMGWVEIKAYLEQAFERLKEENFRQCERLREEIRGLFLEQKGWIVDILEGGEALEGLRVGGREESKEEGREKKEKGKEKLRD